ncbi:MAG: hypothetical protein E4G92_02530, partial [Bacteroidia bacterium]
MVSNKYYSGIILRVALITLSSLLLALISDKANYLYSVTGLLLAVILQTWALIRYILKRRDDIKRMLEYIKENNPSIYFSQSRDYPFNELGDFLNEIGDIVRDVRIEKENQLQYMQYIVQHVGTGLMSFDKEGNIQIINQAAKDLLGVPEINSIYILEKVQPGLPAILLQMKVREQKVLTLLSANRLQQLAIRISVFKIGPDEIRLASFQDIKTELDEKEMDSWQKLIRVLTHEILNSITPVTSLTATISGFFKKGDKVIPAKDLPDNNIQDALTGLGYIEERGKNLIDFVNKFRSLTRLPLPKFEKIKLTEIFDGIAALKKDDLSERGIMLNCHCSPDNIMHYCDRSMIEQVLINLINNSADAFNDYDNSKDRLVDVTGTIGEEENIIIRVTDNGMGIPVHQLENIFIPFFTTKDNGSGIGLSLSRQIMKLHGGTIS